MQSLLPAEKKIKETRKSHNDALTRCRQARLDKMKVAQQKNAEAKGEKYIEAMNYIEQYHLGRCWKTPEQARREFELLDSDPKQYQSDARDLAGRILVTTGQRMDTPSHQASYLIILSM